MSVQTEIDRINGAKKSLSSWLDSNGVEASDSEKIDGLVSLLGDVSLGSDVSGVTAESSDVLTGKKYVNKNGVLVDGEFTLATELTEQDSLISQIQTALEGKATGSGGSLETCSVSITVPANTNVILTSVADGVASCSAMYLPSQMTGTLSILKDSFVVAGYSVTTSSTRAVTITGSIEKVSDNSAYTCGCVFKVTGDGTITISQEGGGSN